MQSCFKIDLGLISMSESKSCVGDYHKMAHIWARIQAFDQVFEIHTVQTCSWYYAKELTLLAASIFVTESLFIYIYFLLFEESHHNRISRAG